MAKLTVKLNSIKISEGAVLAPEGQGYVPTDVYLKCVTSEIGKTFKCGQKYEIEFKAIE